MEIRVLLCFPEKEQEEVEVEATEEVEGELSEEEEGRRVYFILKRQLPFILCNSFHYV